MPTYMKSIHLHLHERSEYAGTYLDYLLVKFSMHIIKCNQHTCDYNDIAVLKIKDVLLHPCAFRELIVKMNSFLKPPGTDSS